MESQEQTQGSNVLQQQELNFRKRIASRKFLMSFTLIGLASALLVSGLIDGEIWKSVILGTLTVYMTGNVANSIWGKKD